MIYPLFATLKEFIITQPAMVSLDIADKLYQFHIIPMNDVRKELGVWVTASQQSGHRPQWYEVDKGRSGNSQHTFKEDWIKGSGAVDWTCKDFKENRDRFLNLIIQNTNYTRICVYDTFLHCDYKDTVNGKREIFRYDGLKWQFTMNVR